MTERVLAENESLKRILEDLPAKWRERWTNLYSDRYMLVSSNIEKAKKLRDFKHRLSKMNEEITSFFDMLEDTEEAGG